MYVLSLYFFWICFFSYWTYRKGMSLNIWFVVDTKSVYGWIYIKRLLITYLKAIKFSLVDILCSDMFNMLLLINHFLVSATLHMYNFFWTGLTNASWRAIYLSITKLLHDVLNVSFSLYVYNSYSLWALPFTSLHYLHTIILR